MKKFIEHNKKIIEAATIVVALIIVAFAAYSIFSNANSINCKISRNDDGSVKINTKLQDLKEKNIEIGDCVTLVFSSAYTAENVAFLNGEYMNYGMHILLSDNDGTNITFTYQSMGGLWEKASLDDFSTVKISLIEKSKFSSLNSAFQKEINGDIKNHRSLRGGNIKLLNFFRGADISSESKNTTFINYTNMKLGVEQNINLDNNALNVDFVDIKNPNSNKMIIDTLVNISNSLNKIYVYSKNPETTAYFCAIFEAIAGASYEEIVNDYMQTYDNFYGINKDSAPDEYNAIKTYHIDWFLHKFTKTTDDYDLNKCDFAYDAEMYLRAQGLNDESINKIRVRILN